MDSGNDIGNDRPVNLGNRRMAWGSDVIAETVRKLDLEYIALVPGASYRGFHDSLVNYLGNERPQMLLCLHEEHAVAIAHGYAKVTDKMIASGLHANIGLMRATMALPRFRYRCFIAIRRRIRCCASVSPNLKTPWPRAPPS